MASRELPLAPVLHEGVRTAPHPPHLARVLRGLARQVDDNRWQRPPQSLAVIPASGGGQPCTGATMTATWRMWTYRAGASAYCDVVVEAGTGSVVAAQLTAPSFAFTGSQVNSAAGGEQVLRLELDYPDAWPPGTAAWIQVQACTVSGTDATTILVARAWQRLVVLPCAEADHRPVRRHPRRGGIEGTGDTRRKCGTVRAALGSHGGHEGLRSRHWNRLASTVR